MQVCVACKTNLSHLPFYNQNDDRYVHSVPFCPQDKCPRFGLLTITFKDTGTGKTGKRILEDVKK